MSRVVLFDFDGTLVRGDSVARFIRSRIVASRWRRAVAWLGLPLLPLFGWWRTAWLPASFYVWLATVGCDETAIARQRQDYLQTCAQQRDRLLIRSAVARLQAHLAAGDRVLVVTGAETTLASALWAALGGPGVEFVGSRMARRWGGYVAQFHCYGPRKVAALAALGVHPPYAAMYSDNARDLPLLLCSDVPVLVAASARERRRVCRVLPGIECLDG